MRQELATLLRKARGFALLTQQQLADEIGISRRAVASYEADENEPPITVVLAWLRACGRPLDDLVNLFGAEALEGEDLGLAARRTKTPATGEDPRRAPRRSRPSPA